MACHLAGVIAIGWATAGCIEAGGVFAFRRVGFGRLGLHCRIIRERRQPEQGILGGAAIVSGRSRFIPLGRTRTAQSSVSEHTFRQGLLKVFHSCAGDLGSAQVQHFELSQPFELLRSGVRDVGCHLS
jgi:hypothetical protein